jgi:HD-GYP domain-containing protein (c-di-GMP phosphodiesterase class II)
MIRRIKIRTNILLHFLFILITLSLALIGTQYYFSEKMAAEAIDKTFHETAEKIAISLKDKDHISKEILYQIESHPVIETIVDEKLPMESVRHFIHTLIRYENMYAIYLGYENGDFFEVINMHISPTIHKHYQAPEKTRWSIIKIYTTPKGRIREFVFLDKQLNILQKRQEPSDYYVTHRTWYQEAVHSATAVRSDPYLFSNLQQKGITYAKKLEGTQRVLALDFTLLSMHKILQSLYFAQSGNTYLYGRNATLIASSKRETDTLSPALKKMILENRINTISLLQTEKGKAYAMVIPLSREMGKETYVGITVSRDEMIAPYRKKIYYSIAVALIFLLMFIPLSLYLTDHIVIPIKALMAENEMIKQRQFEKVKPVETNIVELIELSDSQITMSQSIRDYQKQQEALLDAFIKLIADAIDTKSAYTGAHCKKVPVIARMLADEAEKSDQDPFCAFRFKNSDERTAFQRAAWLHDCGKITTPEYVVDKATKLETIYNRIHEIRTRFEVIWRDIEIDFYERLLHGEDRETLHVWKEAEQQKLTEEFAFIARCNLGSEFMDEKDKTRIHHIAKRQWVRHFDDRLGLSDEELARYSSQKPALPVEESLIDDKPEHLIERIGFDAQMYEKEGFKMEVPQYLYHRGELYNLTLERGTLTPEERYKINEHVIMTIRMLERLPFPENMKEIPKIAGEHHEMVNGEGYPRRLAKEALSIPSRIMAIADIFEALTASDRPYKQAKRVSEALSIMYMMKKENHIDADLFDLFVRKKVYLMYARTYLKPSQIDEVDEERLLG